MNEFDKIFKDKLNNYTETPPPELFNNIASKLPKTSFKHAINANKYYIIAGTAAIIVASVLAFYFLSDDTQPTTAPLTYTYNTTPDAKVANTDAEKYLNFKSQETIHASQPTNKKSQSTKMENYSNNQHLTDTIICGSDYFVEGLKLANIKTSNNIKTSETASGVLFTAITPGTSKVYYQNKNHLDSISLTFVKKSELIATISKSVLCANEALIVDVQANSPLTWNNENYQVRKLSNTKYELSNFEINNPHIELATSDNVCPVSKEFDIQIAQKPELKLSSTDEICGKRNAELQVTTTSTNVNSYKLGSLSSNNGHFTKLAAGTYKMEVCYGGVCTDYLQVEIAKADILTAKFTAEKQAFSDNVYVFTNQTSVNEQFEVAYKWLLNGKLLSTGYNFEHSFAQNGNYEIKLQASAEGCTSSYSKQLSVALTKFAIPNIFTPNGDGIGDEFVISCREKLQSYNLSVFTQAGQLVFESNDINESWNGKISGNNDAAEAVYFYVIKAETISGEILNEKGTVHLKRR